MKLTDQDYYFLYCIRGLEELGETITCSRLAEEADASDDYIDRLLDRWRSFRLIDIDLRTREIALTTYGRELLTADSSRPLINVDRVADELLASRIRDALDMTFRYWACIHRASKKNGSVRARGINDGVEAVLQTLVQCLSDSGGRPTAEQAARWLNNNREKTTIRSEDTRAAFDAGLVKGVHDNEIVTCHQQPKPQRPQPCRAGGQLSIFDGVA